MSSQILVARMLSVQGSDKNVLIRLDVLSVHIGRRRRAQVADFELAGRF